MDFMEKFNISVSMLLTGFTIVFAVLIFLIFLIWLYGTIISSAQRSARDRKIRRELKKSEKETLASPIAETTPKEPSPVAQSGNEGISEEVIAVISAAVYSMYGSKEKVRIKSVRRAKSRPAWANAGVLDNTRPF